VFSKHFTLLHWIILLGVITVLLQSQLTTWGSIAAIIAGSLAVIGAAIGILRWGLPRFKQWRMNRAYIISFSKCSSVSGIKAKSVEVGKHEFSISFEMRSQRDVSVIYLTFMKKKTSGHAGGDIVSFDGLKVDDMTNLPYGSSLEAHGSRATVRFTPFRLLNKGDKLNFTVVIDAKTQWEGRLVFEVREESGHEIQVYRAFSIIAPKQPTPDKEGSQTE
jgi:hypothetical protein